MKNGFFILTVLLLSAGCDYREYPQEEEWKEDFNKEMQEDEKRDREINFTPGNT